jgi:hypothetical protein
MRTHARQREFAEQCALVEWATLRSRDVPDLQWLFHVPNGGWRDKKTAWNLKQMGGKAGIPDLWLCVKRTHDGRTYSGLVIEMKSVEGIVSPEQVRWMNELKRQGFFTCVHRDWISAAERLWWYLKAEGEAIPARLGVGGR